MLLAIDVGNTNIVFALCRDGAVLHRWRIRTDGNRTADEYAVQLTQLFALQGLPLDGVTGAIIATVVPPTLFNLQNFCRRYLNVEPLTVAHGEIDFGIGIALPNPAEVGADRVVNAVAAHQRWPGEPLIVVDFGTATTFDAIAPDGTYLGGAIAPGINLSMDALYRAAAKLPRVAVEPPASGLAVGTGTVHAMQAGVFYGYVGLIEGLASRIRAELGGAAKVIGTGGLASLFARHTSVFDAVDADLTIQGLLLLHARNAK